MENSMSRILIETTVRQTLKGFRANPKRSIRNLVDMALHFSNGRFQSQFFQAAHAMLEHKDSAYYALVEDIVNHVDGEHLVKFGMNLGYNCCMWGAQHIRSNEKRLGCNIPWTILLQMESASCQEHLSQYNQAMEEGENLGIYAWMLFSHTNPLELLPLIKEHPDSAFFLFCQPKDISAAFLEEIASINHLMPVIHWEETSGAVCTKLRKAELPYSIYYSYAQKELPSIIHETLFCEIQRLHPIFTVLVPQPNCPAHVREQAYGAVLQARNGQHYQTVPWELYNDTRRLDEIISDDACSVSFDGQGTLLIPNNPHTNGSLFHEGLTSLIQRFYPKPSPSVSESTAPT